MVYKKYRLTINVIVPNQQIQNIVKPWEYVRLEEVYNTQITCNNKKIFDVDKFYTIIPNILGLHITHNGKFEVENCFFLLILSNTNEQTIKFLKETKSSIFKILGEEKKKRFLGLSSNNWTYCTMNHRYRFGEVAYNL